MAPLFEADIYGHAEDSLDLAIILEDEAMGLYPDAEVYRLAAKYGEVG